MLSTVNKKLVFLRNFLIYKKYNLLSKLRNGKLRSDPDANFVVSIASYPKRSHLLPAVFEALNKQTTVPKKWILVLSEEEWPGLNLPTYLRKLETRGLEIMWVKNNTFAVKKLVPILEKFPKLDVITFDDELIYGKQVIKNLIKHSIIHKGAIVGHVGKQLIQKNGELRMSFREKKDADHNTPSEQLYFLGGSGTFYPANSLHNKVTQIDAIHNIVPGRGSDMWFWAAAIAKGTKQVCLGTRKGMNLYFAIPTTDKTKPKDTPGAEVMEQRFQMTIDYFEIRQQLLRCLPDKDTLCRPKEKFDD